MATTYTQEIVLGIDLGTTNACVAFFENGQCQTIQSGDGRSITPTCVAFTEEGRIYGRAAKDTGLVLPLQTIHSIKRIIGMRYADPEVAFHAARWSFTVVNHAGNAAVQVVENGALKTFTPEQIGELLLRQLKAMAEDYFSRPIRKAVITIPANFTDSQRVATKCAGTLAGFDVIGIINEPTAAAVAYGFQEPGDRVMAVVDFGGGTLDVSILRIHDGRQFDVLATSGDMQLGGDDFDERIMRHWQATFERQHGVSLRENAAALAELRQKAETAKITLASGQQDRFRFAIPHLDGVHTFSGTITNGDFLELCDDLYARVPAPVHDALHLAGLSADTVDHVVLVGGSSLLPRVKEIMSGIFPGRTICRDVNPAEAIACGAAIYGSALQQSNVESSIQVVEVVPKALGAGGDGWLYGGRDTAKHGDTLL